MSHFFPLSSSPSPLTSFPVCVWKQEDEEDGTTLLLEDRDEELAPAGRKAAWVDDDDELEEEWVPIAPRLLSAPSRSSDVCLCFRVDMKHRYRGDLVRGEAESTMSKQKLQQRMREQ